MNSLRSYIKYSKECFLLFPNTSKLVKKTRLCLVFPTYSSVFGNRRKHSSSCLSYYFNIQHGVIHCNVQQMQHCHIKKTLTNMGSLQIIFRQFCNLKTKSESRKHMFVSPWHLHSVWTQLAVHEQSTILDQTSPKFPCKENNINGLERQLTATTTR